MQQKLHYEAREAKKCPKKQKKQIALKSAFKSRGEILLLLYYLLLF